MTKKEDRRVVRTKKAIRGAFAALLAKKDYNDITVTDIAEAADINRKTFYNYYHNTEDLIEEIQNDLVTSFDDIAEGLAAKDILDNPRLIVERISKVISDNEEQFRDIVLISSNMTLFNRIADNVKKDTFRKIRDYTPINPVIAEVLSIFVSAGCIWVYRDLLNSQDLRNKNQVEKIVTALCTACMSAGAELYNSGDFS